MAVPVLGINIKSIYHKLSIAKATSVLDNRVFEAKLSLYSS